MDSDSNIKMHRIKEVYRADPVGMSIYSDELDKKGIDGYILLETRDFLSTEV